VVRSLAPCSDQHRCRPRDVTRGTLDGRLTSLDAESGRVIWRSVTLDQTKNRVIIGNGGGGNGLRG
jgi:outer membrane protein assembly factor BamB